MLTLQELKQVVGNREERRKVPSARYLRENDVAVVKQRLIDGAEIIAYQTGYVFYCVGDYGTVFPLFTCRDYVYEAGRKITVVKEDFFDNQPWYVRLILEGEDRLCRNKFIFSSVHKEKCHGCLELQNRQYQNVFHRQSRK